MANKIKVKLIMELLDAGMSRNAIAATRKMSKHSVSSVIHISKEKGIKYSDVRDLSEDEVYRMFYPEKFAVETLYKNVDYQYIHSELRKVGVTLKLLWEEYKDKCTLEESIPMGYTKFCRGYKDYTIKSQITNHLQHKPGLRVEVDWSGKKMYYTDPGTGEMVAVYLFVATLPYSQYSYVKACLDMKQDTWLDCHIQMYEFFGGVPVATVCDNLKTGVIKHPRDGEIILNESYESLGSHYMSAIMPTGVRKPKEKASVEGTIGKIATAIIAKLRNHEFFSLDELQRAIHEKLDEFNRQPFQKRDYSRLEAFMEEKKFLGPLPEIPYEISSWVYGRKVNLNCHVIFEKNYYSCPYQHVGKKADLKITERTVEIYVSSERVATHKRLGKHQQYKYSTHKEDMPDQFTKLRWDYERIVNWAYSIGSYTGHVIDQIFSKVQIKEQGYNPSLSVLRLGKTYTDERLETACELALTKVSSPRYHHLKAILSANQDLIFLETRDNPKDDNKTLGGFVRGSEYYGGLNNAK